MYFYKLQEAYKNFEERSHEISHTGQRCSTHHGIYPSEPNPGFVQRKKAGLLNGMRGQAAPSLTQEPSAITLLDIYRAVEGNKPLLHLDTHTNPACGVGVNIQLALSDYYAEIQKSAESRMAEITLENIIRTYYDYIRRADPNTR